MALLLVFWATMRLGVAPVEAARVSDVRNTKHNFSANSSSYTVTGTIPGSDQTARNVVATSETQVCVFCHTPHGATNTQGPLWNRKVAGQGYTQNYIMYDSSTLDAKQVQGALNQPGGSSKLCLSCHDGTVAIGNVNVLNGTEYSSTAQTTSNIATNTAFMPTGTTGGEFGGFTRKLGTDLGNDHPISVSYNATLAGRDGELRTPTGDPVGPRSKGVKPKLPLEKTGPAGNEDQIQCAACHDPHIREKDANTLLTADNVKLGNQKFLRLNRFQGNKPPSATGFDATTEDSANPNKGDIICMACHEKNQTAGEWSYSVHANPTVANEVYSDAAADLREFPRGLPVWKAACLNCHDTHTVYGSKRLLREGTNMDTLSPKPGGVGTAALEETCYQCHDGGGNATLKDSTNVPNIKQDFQKTRHMPIRSDHQAAGTEKHDINSNFTDTYNTCNTATSKCGKDLMESRENLGFSDTDTVNVLKNRHAECTDCHNPHRVIRAANGLPGTLSASNTSTDTRATHTHAAGHTNAISGALRGAWGVEPKYTGTDFFSMPTSFDVKRGDPGIGTYTASADSATYVTREYQICLKCHSNYGYYDGNAFNADRPMLNSATGLTGTGPDGRTNFDRYTNQAREFQPNESRTNTGAGASYQTNNKRSWHPVIGATGRLLNSGTSSRGISSSSPWLAPWTNGVGTQTMYCTDCHGSGTTGKTVDPGTNPWGPHGSDNKFILKGVWGPSMGGTGRDSGETANFLCFKCHDSAVYTTRSDSGRRTGFYDGTRGKGNLHNYHVDRIQKIYCTWCHVAVPHGWKNKMLLVNLNDVGAEAGQTGSKEVAINGSSDVYSNGPYYVNAKLKIKAFSPSGNWDYANCGSSGKSGTNLIANKSGGTSNNTSSDINWMKSVCTSPP